MLLCKRDHPLTGPLFVPLYSFGAVLEEFEVRDALSNVLAAKELHAPSASYAQVDGTMGRYEAVMA